MYVLRMGSDAYTCPRSILSAGTVSGLQPQSFKQLLDPLLPGLVLADGLLLLSWDEESQPIMTREPQGYGATDRLFEFQLECVCSAPTGASLPVPEELQWQETR